MGRMIRLTRAGKIVVGALVVLFMVLIYSLFFSSKEAPPQLDGRGRPAGTLIKTIPSPFRFPLQGDQLALWRERSDKNLKLLKKANSPLTYCSLAGSVDDLRGFPLTFLAIRGLKGDSPNYEQFYQYGSATNTQYYPVYPVASQPGGADQAMQALGISQDSDSKLEGCGISTQSPDGQPVVRPLLVAFPPGANIKDRFIRIDGFIEGSYGLNTLGTSVPLIRAGNVEGVTAIESIDQPAHDIPLNIHLRHQDRTRKGVVLHIERIQYTEFQTRIKISLINELERPMINGWQGADGNIFLSSGRNKGESVCPGGVCPNQPEGLNEAALQLVKSENVNDIGVFNPQEEIPANYGVTSGWLVFPTMPYGEVLTLRMPDLPPYDDSPDPSFTPFVIKIDPNKE